MLGGQRHDGSDALPALAAAAPGPAPLLGDSAPLSRPERPGLDPSRAPRAPGARGHAAGGLRARPFPAHHLTPWAGAALGRRNYKARLAARGWAAGASACPRSRVQRGVPPQL